MYELHDQKPQLKVQAGAKAERLAVQTQLQLMQAKMEQVYPMIKYIRPSNL